MTACLRRTLILMPLLATAALAQASTNVGVSVSVNQPGVYGRIDIGNMPPPPVIYTQPVVIERRSVREAPIYMRVPPGHERNWAKHCRAYNACGRPVYFVRDEPRGERHDHGDDHDHDRHEGKGRGHGHGRH